MERLTIMVLLLSLFLAGCSEPAAEENVTPTAADPGAVEGAGLPNPASVFCEEAGYRLELRSGEGGVSGYCIFDDGSECDEWAYFRGECGPGEMADTAEQTPLSTEAPPTVSGAAADDWQVYYNEDLTYAVSLPPGVEVEPGDDPLRTLNLRGPLVDDEYWPLIFISHPRDRAEFRPPPDANLEQWLVANNLLAPANQPDAPEMRMGEVPIAGESAVHVRFERSPQSYAYDKYFFAHNGQLFVIVLLHTGDREEWALYDRFLKSFQFVP